MEDNGYELKIFHQVGTPETLESLVADGYISGVLDITTTEWAIKGQVEASKALRLAPK